ncbi:MAG: WD40 repeat domain-containing protein [Acetobacteraceae bacterium]
MGETVTAHFLIESRGVTRDLGAFVVAARFDRGGRVAAFALGDGSLRLVDVADPETWRDVAVHDGAVLSLASHPTGGWASGGDDGRFRHTTLEGTATDIASFGSKWVEQAASSVANGVLACSVGKLAHLFDASGAKVKELPHPSTITGLAFDAKGKRIGASYYNGASIWFVAAKTDSPRLLEWKGSHTGIIIHPDAEAVVTAMQENALHGWALPDGKHMRMSGYPGKTHAMSFTRTGKWLATSGADAMVLWPFFGGGPMGKAPMELAGGDGIVCTQVACHPKEDMVAGGFADGLVVLADIDSSRILPVAPPEHGAVSTLAWNATGSHLAIGTESGFAAIVDFSKRG